MGELFPSCLFPPAPPSSPNVSPLGLLLHCSLLGAKVLGTPGRASQGAGRLSASSEALLAGSLRSKSCSRGPLLCLLSPADDDGEEKAHRERMTPQSRSGNPSPPPRGEGCWKGAQAKHCQ